MANSLTVLDHRDTGERVEISLTPFDGLLTVDRVRATLPGLILDHLDVLRGVVDDVRTLAEDEDFRQTVKKIETLLAKHPHIPAHGFQAA